MSIDRNAWLILAAAGGAAFLLYLLGPVLTPFATAALLAYIGDPLVDSIETRGRSRTVAVVSVFLLLFLGGLLLLLVLVPLLEQQVVTLARKLPAYIDWVQNHLLPHLGALAGADPQSLSLEGLKSTVVQHWQSAGGLLMGLLANVSQSGLLLVGWLANLVLVPVVTFYLLRDWDVILAHVQRLLPRRLEATVVRLARDCDRVLAEFLRGQVLVMACLALIYTLGLWLAGLDLALLIGMISGLASFVPYLGLLLGITLAGLAAFFQFHEVLPLLYVAAVFTIGQLVEGTVLTPLFVGERIGLHPVAVIFAVLAGGQLFGFIGVLLALPAAAVTMVLLREFHRRYVDSGLYRS